MVYQKTVKNNISWSGIGVHSGEQCTVSIWPAEESSGIVLLRNSTTPQQTIKIGTVIPQDAMHATVLKQDGWLVSTVEHLLAAILMLGIDNAILEIKGNEIPILDGSALPFIQGLLDIGTEQQHAQKKIITPRIPLSFSDNNGRSINISQATQEIRNFSISYTTQFAHPLAGLTSWNGIITTENFYTDLAPARTFGFLEHLPFLRQYKLAQGTSLGNTVVIGDELINDMRLPNECVRHKVLDLIGDLSLLGHQLIGTITAQKTSHNFNRLVIEHKIKHPEDWIIHSQ